MLAVINHISKLFNGWDSTSAGFVACLHVVPFATTSQAVSELVDPPDLKEVTTSDLAVTPSAGGIHRGVKDAGCSLLARTGIYSGTASRDKTQPPLFAPPVYALGKGFELTHGSCHGVKALRLSRVRSYTLQDPRGGWAGYQVRGLRL